MNRSLLHQGFTLVELAIVLVIIGLIVGGVLVGQDMIKAAEIRSTVGQYEKYNAAVNTFRTKYNGIPGDLLSTYAANFGLATRNGGNGHGDGNGILSPCGGNLNAGCETTVFWRDLSDANLIPNRFSAALGDQLTPVAAGSVGTVFPLAALGRGNYFTVYSASMINYYELTGIDHTDNSGIYTLTLNLTPAEAYNIDNKIDNGAPMTGAVTASDFTGALSVAATPAAPAAGVCVSNATGNPYNTGTQAYASAMACQLIFRF